MIPVMRSHIQPVRATEVFDTYWKFAAERQEVFFKRVAGVNWPWTDDPIIRRHKFTNVYRAADRVSQYLIRNVIYDDRLSSKPDEVFFRILLFKLFNKIDTWELLLRELGDITFAAFSFDRYDEILTDALSRNLRIYSGAYIMPSGGRASQYKKKHRTHLRLLEMMMNDHVWEKISDAKSMQRGFYLLREYPTIGDFLAYQFIVDINYSELTNFSESEFVVPGPGALDGISKCFNYRGGLNEAEIIRFVVDIQESEFERLGLEFKTLWGRRLHLIDCQNLFCEVSKYSRVSHPNVTGIAGRVRIKQIYKQTLDPIEYWFPPKWGLNELISRSET